MPNLFVSETFVNSSEGHLLSEPSEPYETAHSNVSGLYAHLRKEYGGRVSKIYLEDDKGNARQVGWTFTKKTKYDDVNETFLREVWVTVYEEPPVFEYVQTKPARYPSFRG